MDRLSPTAVRYIKLGPGGEWLRRCLADGMIEFGHASVPHALAAAGDWPAVEALLRQDRTPSKASDFLREVKDFYQLDADALWITIGEGKLWWAFAEPAVFAIEEAGRGARARRVIGAWRDTNLSGEVLRLGSLSTRLTKVAAYRQTLCRVEAEAYLVRRLNGEPEPSVEEAITARSNMTKSARSMIEMLDWRDFEVLVDLIFAGSGWRRSSGVGGSDQADTDLILEQAVTGERAFVQVKSAANAATLSDHVLRFQDSAIFDRAFFICHSPKANLTVPADSRIAVWLGDTLAEQAVKAGLFDWLLAKSR